MKRDYGVFIIEAIKSDDLIEGEYLKDILTAAKVFVEHRYVSTKEEFENAINQFETFNFRYLHIACHGLENKIGFSLVNEDLLLNELELIVRGKMKNRRVSLSICFSGRKEIAALFIRDGAFSVISHPDAVQAKRSSLFWTNFYLLMNDEDKWKMKRKFILQYLKSLTRMLKISIHYYSFLSKERKTKMKRVIINSHGITKNKRLKMN